MSVLPKGLAVEVAARAAWSRVAEPGDRQAVALVDRLGAVDALAAVVEGHDWVPEALRVRAAGVDLEGLVQFAFRRGWRMVVPGADEWPIGVDALDVPPIGLWVAGPVDLASISARSVAVVGARACTAYGVDRAAHQGCLSVDGTTVAVLAGGLDRPYPVTNAGLIERIGQTGALVSEVAPGGAPTKFRFLQRNRLIATLAVGTVVVEAGLRSGSLHTAGRALEHGRPVGAVPGPVTSRTSAGCHQAIRDQKATLVTDLVDVLDLVGRLGVDAAPLRRGPVRPEDDLPVTDRQVFAAVPIRASASSESIAINAGVSLAQARSSLGRLELGGIVTRAGDRWKQVPVRHRSVPP